MSDLIERDALIEKLESDREYFERMKDTVFAIATIGVINDIKKAPTIEVPKWIPCSERMPNIEDNPILVSSKGFVNIAWYNGKVFECGTRLPFPANVDAWMPLPKPYKETDHE